MIVWAWTLAALLGTLAAAWNTVEAWRDLRALGEVRNGRRLLAVGWIRRECIRTFVQGVWTSLGLAALSMGSDRDPTIFAYLLLLTTIAVAINTSLDARERILLRHLVEGT